jgi:hypothetical protein
MAPSGPFKLVTVNTAPDRAKRLIGRVVENVKEKYTIIHSGNAASTQPLPYLHLRPTPNTLTGIDDVRKVVEEFQPNVLVCTQTTSMGCQF